ncbi:hypothetical protein [Roseovarius sp. SYSU LYC5161]|uniref:hypothetical protein n=1 Tax=Roseovarius halophilus (ex Wu et al. 2025) TaxID=3376060 RepID=UPI00399A1D57
MKHASTLDRGLLGLIIATLVATVAIYLVDPVYFHEVYAAEDKLVEYGTAVFLLMASLVLLRNAGALRGRRAPTLAVGLTLVYALMFFAAAGEEISWGQRIIGWESGEFFEEHNKQNETNFHNLVVGDLHLAKTLFGSVLTTVLLLYLVALPLAYPRLAPIRRLADRLAVPVPGTRHAIFAVAASIVIAAIDVHRKWEVYELVFSLLACSIFLRPQNRERTT